MLNQYAELAKELQEQVISPTIRDLHQQGLKFEEALDQTISWLMLSKLHLTFSEGGSQIFDLLIASRLQNSAIWSHLPEQFASDLRMNFAMRIDNQLSAAAAACYGRIQILADEYGIEYWPIADAIALIKTRGGPQHWLNEYVVAGLFDALRAEEGSRVLIPYDWTGQIGSEALKRGLIPVRSPILGSKSNLQMGNVRSARLILASAGQDYLNNHIYNIHTDVLYQPLPQVDYGVICPPLGLKVSNSESLTLSPCGSSAFPISSGHFAGTKFTRIETASIPIGLSYISERCVFLCSQNILFGAGEDQRVREMLYFSGNNPTSVLALPPGTYSDTSALASILVFNRQESNSDVMMLSRIEHKDDLTCLRDHDWYLGEGLDSEIIGTNKGHLAALPDYMRLDNVLVNTTDDIQPPDFSWQPSEYIAKTELSDRERIPLENLFEIIRCVPFSKASDTGETVREIGIPQLGSFLPIEGNDCKQTTLSKKTDQYYLKPNDIILSVKGTVGKTGLYSGEKITENAVCSPACVALRLKDCNNIDAGILFMYFQTEDFQKQVEGFSGGALISSLTLSNLKKIRIPADLCGTDHPHKFYFELQKLQELERRRSEIEQEMCDILDSQIHI